MEEIRSHLPDYPLKNKNVLVRADLNLPLDKHNSIADTFRLEALMPTLQMIKKKEGSIVLIGHWGRPSDKDPLYSTKKLVDWFEKQNFKTAFAHSIEEIKKLQTSKNYDLILLENLRYFPEEIDCNTTFAEQLASCGTYFIQDAFGALHREHSSITLLPTLFQPEKRTVGLLVERELRKLNNLLKKENRPLMLILGGSKTETKLPLIESFIDNADSILLCPALVFTFLKAQSVSIGNSLYDVSMVSKAKKIIEKSEGSNTKLIYPSDYLITNNTFEKPFPSKIVSSLSGSMTGISIGPKTIQRFKQKLSEAHTIFFNGIFGNERYPETLEGVRALFYILQNLPAKKIIAGGDTVALARSFGFKKELAHFSTGGGAALHYLASGTLVGLLPFIKPLSNT